MTTMPTPASGARMGSGTALPRAGRSGSATGAAPMKNNNYQLLQVVLFWAGAILLPLGLVVIVLGWYGAANTPYQYDQLSYLVSGGLLGLGLTFVGGFLYFGAWLARIADDGRESSKRLADTLLVLADVTSRSAAVNDQGVDTSALPVTAGEGTTIHRRDCALVAHRSDLHPLGEAEAQGRTAELTTCRVCKP
ncbi:hypothetical protein GGQ22_12515 [Nocardioides sp. zg-579]|uniref:Uncharacterized protein n=1 Tax=Nocardioides marmotae TaxID=2663857 RepID=A0A6I3JD00_9ACTN|nr:hypothetical protein [Nocardioides marmotae]MCR6032255.1 hypothetical protein [Gordonia jinghuaiqii]MTB95903.1 hypothetical protein [Nocardioides marmotae]QKE02753.1 hypothetical protein HPC71_18020 [Nocardioides marmotae]